MQTPEKPSFVSSDKKSPKVLGYYRHNGPEPIEDVNRSFETASYWEKSEIAPGIYPIYGGWNVYGRHQGEATLYIAFEGKVVDDYFPSSFGGVVYSQPGKKHVGEKREITRRISFKEAITKTGVSPNKPGEGPDIYIDPEFWEPIAEYLEARLVKDLESLEYFKNKARKDPVTGKEDAADYIGGIKHSAGWVEQTADELASIYQSMAFAKKPSFAKLKETNTAWVPTQKKVKFATPNAQEPIMG